MRISVAVLTKSRPEQLRRCLKSLANQTFLPDQLLVIDNDDRPTGNKIIKLFPNLKIKYIHLPFLSVADIRNEAIKSSTSDIIAFIDDDCIAQNNWIENGLKLLKKLNKIGFIVGRSDFLMSNSLIAVSEYLHHAYWFKFKLKFLLNKNYAIANPFNFDTKNIFMRRSIYIKNKLKFDSRMCDIHGFDVSDTDLGFQLAEHEEIGLFASRVLVYHPETGSFIRFIQKTFYKYRLSRKIAGKWKLKAEFVDNKLKSPLNFIKSIKKWPQQFQQYEDISIQLGLNKLERYYCFFLIKVKELVALIAFT